MSPQVHKFERPIQNQGNARRIVRVPTLAALSIVLSCLATPSPAASRDNEVAGRPDSGLDAICLPVHTGLAPNTALLRLAAPPLDSKGGGGAQAVVSRMLGAGAAAKNGADLRLPTTGVGRLLFGTASPLATLLVDGSADAMAGRHADSQRRLTECSRVAAEANDSLSEAACVNNLAVTLAAQGQLAQARSQLERALDLYGQPRVPPSDVAQPSEAQAGFIESTLRWQIDRLPAEMRARYEADLRAMLAQAAPESARAMTALWRRVERLNTRRGIERTHLNLGNLALASGRIAEAKASLQRAQDSHNADDSAQCKAATELDIERLSRGLGAAAGNPGPARRSSQPATEAADEIGQLELGTIQLAAADSDRTRANRPALVAHPKRPSAIRRSPSHWRNPKVASATPRCRNCLRRRPATRRQSRLRRRCAIGNCWPCVLRPAGAPMWRSPHMPR